MKKNTYKSAGVDIALADSFVNKVKNLADETKRVGLLNQIGDFSAFFDIKATGLKDPILTFSTDGVGTKLKLAYDYDYGHKYLGMDLVAMCANDIICSGAKPILFLDYFATGKLNIKTGMEIIDGIKEACILSDCALVGGETAEMPLVYNENHYDLAGFMMGAIERKELEEKHPIEEGDIILGLQSSGLHSNGFSLIHKIVNDYEILLFNMVPGTHQTFLLNFMQPTRNYVKSILSIKHKIKGIAHITGGGLTENIARILPDSLTADIKICWKFLPIYKWINKYVEIKEMLNTFNCGIGMVIIVSSNVAELVKTNLTLSGEKVFTIGTVERNDSRVVYDI